MKVDFTKLKVQFEIEGEPISVDVSKTVGNIIYKQTSDIGLSDFARKIYYECEVEIPQQYINEIIMIVENCNLIAPVKKAIMDSLRKG